MFNIRTFHIDYTSNEATLPDGNIAGYQGEHNATQLLITPPEEMSNCADITTYRVAFELTYCRAVHSESVEKADQIILMLPSQITSSKTIAVQLEGYSADGNLVAKSKKVAKIQFDSSVCGVEVEGNSSSNSLGAEVAAHTVAIAEIKTELDKFGESNGNLTYNGTELQKARQTTTQITGTTLFVVDASSNYLVLCVPLNETTEILVNKEIASVEIHTSYSGIPEGWIDIMDVKKYDVLFNPYVESIKRTYVYDGMIIVSIPCFVTGNTGLIGEILNSFNYTDSRITYYND